MATVNDVLHHIAQDFHSLGLKGVSKDGSSLMVASRFSLSVAITTDLEDTEQTFLQRFGRGRTFYFRLKSYEQGKNLAAELYKVFNGEMPDMEPHTGSLFNEDDVLFLFVHLRVLPSTAEA